VVKFPKIAHIVARGAHVPNNEGLFLMFYGEFRHTVDEKSRLSIPSRFRTLLMSDGTEIFFLSRGLDKYLLLCTAKKWHELEAGIIKHPLTNLAARKFRRAFYSGAGEVSFDKQGRIPIPQPLLEYAEIKRDVVVVGVSDAIEIWDAAKWDESEPELLKNLSQAAEQLGKESTEEETK